MQDKTIPVLRTPAEFEAIGVPLRGYLVLEEFVEVLRGENWSMGDAEMRDTWKTAQIDRAAATLSKVLGRKVEANALAIQQGILAVLADDRVSKRVSQEEFEDGEHT